MIHLPVEEVGHGLVIEGNRAPVHTCRTSCTSSTYSRSSAALMPKPPTSVSPRSRKYKQFRPGGGAEPQGRRLPARHAGSGRSRSRPVRLSSVSLSESSSCFLVTLFFVT